MKQTCEQSSGQTLVLALVLMMILVLAAFFLFDYQSLIRSKLKVEIAAQAGALSAAQWQSEALNLIGELNLVKASNALLAEVPPLSKPSIARDWQDADHLARILASERVLTEMQTRVSFTAPLIGWGAAEQAVKNNGINGERNLINRAVDRYIDKIMNDEDDRYPDVVNGYRWRNPYVAMLRTLQDSTHLAVRPSGIFAGIDSVDPAWLGEEELYRAIRTRNWCHPTLNRLVKSYPDEFWAGTWFQVDLSPATFPEESEVFTLDIRFDRLPQSDQELSLMERQLKRYGLEWNLLPNGFLNWALYGASWLPGSGAYTGPDLTVWQGPGRDSGGGPYYYLRGNLKQSAIYGGPVAAVELEQSVPTASRYVGAVESADAGAQEAWNAGLVREVENPIIPVTNYSVARAIGEIPDGSGRPPVASPVILPVFRGTVLIPGSLLRYRMMPEGGSRLEAFLIWLSTADSLYQPSNPPSVGLLPYLKALQDLADRDWRRQGWNPDWRWVPGSTALATAIFTDQFPDPERKPGWLQFPAIRRLVNPERYPPGRLTVETQPNGSVAYHWGERYFVQLPGGLLETNEATKCFAMSGSGGPGGIHTGPSHR